MNLLVLRERCFQQKYPYFLLSYILASLAFSICSFRYDTLTRAALSAASMLFLLIPPILFRILRTRPQYQLTILTDLFFFLSFVIGMSVRGYEWIPYYDKIVHCFAGFFFSLLGLLLFDLISGRKKTVPQDCLLVCFFVVGFSTILAVTWETAEYVISLFSLSDPQYVRLTGVHDTMLDLIVCTVGALLFCIPTYFHYRKGKTDFFLGIHQIFLSHLK